MAILRLKIEADASATVALAAILAGLERSALPLHGAQLVPHVPLLDAQVIEDAETDPDP